jgi:hypothetical protein
MPYTLCCHRSWTQGFVKHESYMQTKRMPSANAQTPHEADFLMRTSILYIYIYIYIYIILILYLNFFKFLRLNLVKF